MGDQKAALTAQLVHTTALRDRNLLPDEAWMTFGFPPPCADSWEGAYQDDHALVSVVPPGEEGERVLENARATRSQVHTAYQDVGIVRKMEKEVTGATEGVVWGGELSTERRDVGGEVGKVHFLAMITLRVCCVGVISGWLLQKLLGCWVHHLCFRRCGFSLLDFSFAWMRQKDVPKHQKRNIPPSVSDELLALAILWPCWRADLSATIAPRAFCSDATLTRGCVAECDLDCDSALFLWGRAPRRGGVTTFEGFADRQKDLFQVTGGAKRDPIVHEWIESAQFREIVSYNFRSVKHVNVQETVAFRTMVKHIAKDPSLHGKRIVAFVDSQVLQNTVGKGRSSSHILNALMTSISAYMIFCNLYFLMYWVASKFNPSDDGTRNRPMRTARKRSAALRQVVGEQAGRMTAASRVHRSLWPRREAPFVHFFSGPRDPLSAAFRRLGWATRSIDLQTNPDEDLCKASFLEEMQSWIGTRRPAAGFLGPPCKSFSSWMRISKASTRTSAAPWGQSPSPAEVTGNRCVHAAVALAASLDRVEACWDWEQPATSLMWLLDPLRKVLASRPAYEVTFHWCEWGQAWKKATTVKGRSDFLPRLERRCSGRHTHQVLEGTTRIGGETVPWTQVASEYSGEWCHKYAELAHARWQALVC